MVLPGYNQLPYRLLFMEPTTIEEKKKMITREGKEVCIGDVVRISHYHQPGIFWYGLATTKGIIDSDGIIYDETDVLLIEPTDSPTITSPMPYDS